MPPIVALVKAPTVSEDRASPESKLATESTRLQSQADQDSKFDTVIERFNSREEISLPLVGTGLAILLLGVSVWFSKKRK
jgi:hypothetical protein